MAYSVDENWHIDLSPCYQGFGCDLIMAKDISFEYCKSEMQSLVAWDGTPIKGLEHEGTWEKLVSKHKTRTNPFNPLMSLDLNRVVRLPLLKAVVTGMVNADVYQSQYKGKKSMIQIVVSGIDENYVVVLGAIKDGYVIRSAYPSDERYSRKIALRGTLVDRIRI